MTSLSETSILLGSSGISTGYTIDQSIRFNDDDTAYMYRNVDTTFSNKFTISYWWKKGASSANRQYHITWRDKRGSGYAYSYLGIFSDNFYFTEHADHSVHGLQVKANYATNRVFRDHSAWYHIVASVDYTESLGLDQVKIYINGERETSFSAATNNTSLAAQSQSTGSPNYLGIGYLYGIAGTDQTDGYLAEINFVDGYAYGPEYFGEFKEDTDIWIPKEYTGSYGSNGYYIDGRDSGDLGDDESGQGNDFTTSGLAAHDQVLDSPTNNFCVMSPIDFTYNAIRNGNLETIGGNNNKGGRGTMGFSSGKFYWEMLATTVSDGYPGSGVVYDSYASSMPTAYAGGGTNYGSGASHNQANWYKQSTSGTAYGSTASSGDILQYALDRDNNKIYWGVNGTYRNSGDPAGGTGAVASSLTHYGAWMPFVNHGSNAGTSASTFNFGQDGTFAGAKTAQGNSDGNNIGNFYYSPPSGFLALCTKNLGS